MFSKGVLSEVNSGSGGLRCRRGGFKGVSLCWRAGCGALTVTESRPPMPSSGRIAKKHVSRTWAKNRLISSCRLGSCRNQGDGACDMELARLLRYRERRVARQAGGTHGRAETATHWEMACRNRKKMLSDDVKTRGGRSTAARLRERKAQCRTFENLRAIRERRQWCRATEWQAMRERKAECRAS